MENNFSGVLTRAQRFRLNAAQHDRQSGIGLFRENRLPQDIPRAARRRQAQRLLHVDPDSEPEAEVDFQDEERKEPEQAAVPQTQIKYVRMRARVPFQGYIRGKEERYEHVIDSYVQIKYRDRQSYQDALEDAKMNNLAGVEFTALYHAKMIEEEVRWSVSNTLTMEQFHAVAKRPMTYGMGRKVPTWYDFGEGVALNPANNGMSCGLNWIIQTYNNPELADSKRMKKLTPQTAIMTMLPKNHTVTGEQMTPEWWANEMTRNRTVEEIHTWCEKNSVSMYAIDTKHKLIGKHVAPNQNRSPLMFICRDSHMYPIVDLKTRKHIVASNSASSSNVKAIGLTKSWEAGKEEEMEQKAIERTKLKSYVDVPLIDILDNPQKYTDCNIFYHQLNLYKTMLTLYKQHNKVPKYKTVMGKFVMLDLPTNNVRLYANPNHALPGNVDWTHSRLAAEKLGVIFTNQSIASIVTECRDIMTGQSKKKILKMARKATTPELRMQIAKDQDHKCYMCKEGLGLGWETDHVVRLEDGGSNDRENLKAACKACHTAKTAIENANALFGTKTEQSSYNYAVKQIFQESKNGLIHHFLVDDLPDKRWQFGVDGCRFRTNIVEYNKNPYLRFSVLDNIEVFDPENSDHSSIPPAEYYIRLPEREEPTLPFKFSGWYNYVQVRSGLANKVIASKNITMIVLPALKTLPADHYSSFIKHLRVKLAADGLDKAAINSFIGNLGCKVAHQRELSLTRSLEHAAYEKFTTNESIDTKCHVTRRRFDEAEDGDFDEDDDKEVNDDDFYYEVVTETKSYRDENTVPIFRQILAQEAVELYHVTLTMKKHNGRLLFLNTDQAVADFPTKADMERCKKEVLAEFWDDKEKVPKWKISSKINNLHRGRQEKKPLDKESTFLEKHVWADIYKDEGSMDFKTPVKAFLDEPSSLLLTGIGGCGKTHFVKVLTEELAKRDITYQCVAPTNVAARRLPNGLTIHKFFQKIGNAKKLDYLKTIKFFFIDEISMMSETFFKVLSFLKTRLPESHFILVGDMGQLLPVQDRSDKFKYEDSHCLWQLCGGNRIALEVCRRADDRLTNIAKRIRKGEEVDTDSLFDTKHCKKSISFTHSTRKKVNAYWMKKLKPELSCNYIEIAKNKSDKNSQDMIVFEGMPIVSRMNQHDNDFDICKNDSYVVRSFNKDGKCVRVSLVLDDGIDDQVIKIPFYKFATFYWPGYCITAHQSQGSTIREPYTIYEYNHYLIDRRWRYVAVSRGTCVEHVNIDRRKYPSPWAKETLVEAVDNEVGGEEDENYTCDRLFNDVHVSERAVVEI